MILVFKKMLSLLKRRLVSSSLQRSYRYISHLENLKVYNSLTKRSEPFKLNNPNALYWYSCGPTVYDDSHIGHAW